MNSSTRFDLGSPRMRDRSSRHNRKTVVVEQKIVKANVPHSNKPQSPRHGPALDATVKDSGDTHLKPPTEVFKSSEGIATDRVFSSPDSVRSSCSSLVDAVSSVSGDLPPSPEDKILEYLQYQISESAKKIYQLEKEVLDIPNLRKEVDKLDKERTKLANDMLDSQELVKAMKQRISVLHEQNEQLAQLATGERSESLEVLKIRNTLVASLAQLKQLQQQVETIPALKIQLRLLTDENTQLKEKELERTKQVSGQNCSPVDYQALQKENEDLKQTNASHVKSLNERLDVITSTCGELTRKIESHSSSVPVVHLLQEQVTKLESENESLHHKVVDLKLHGSGFVDGDTAYLNTELSELKMRNSQLRCQLQQLKVESEQEKSRLILKLFELETLKIMNQKYELEGQILERGMSAGIASPDCNTDPQEQLYDSSTSAESSTAVKQQFLKLNQLKLHYQQSHQLLQTSLAEKEDLEKRISVLTAQLEGHEVTELQTKLSERETKLKIAHERIAHLEQQLSHSSDSSIEVTTILSENAELSQKLGEVQSFYQESLEVIRDLKKIEEQQKNYEALQLALRKAKDDKRKAEKKYRSVNDRMQTLARELSSSAELVKGYQMQCAQLQKELESAQVENNDMRSEAAVLKANLEVVRVERESSTSHSTVETKICELEQSCEKLSKENEQLTDNLQKTTLGFEQQLVTLQRENSVLSSENVKYSADLKARTCELEKQVVEYENLQGQLSEALDSTSEMKNKLEVEIMALKNDSDKSSRNIAGLQVQLDNVSKQLADALKSKEKEELAHITTKEELQRSSQLVCSLQKGNECLKQEAQSLKEKTEELNQSLIVKDRELDSMCTKSKSAALSASTEKERLMNLLRQNESNTESRIASLIHEKDSLHSKLQQRDLQLESKLQKANLELESLREVHVTEESELHKLREQSRTMTDEVEGYKAMVDSLHKRLEEAETREIEHEHLRSKIRMLERLLGDSSHDNKTLVKLLHDTVSELPSYSTEATRSLQDENLKLEEQISVLSQWNDKQRQEIEDLEQQTYYLQKEKHQLLLDLTAKEGHVQENLQLKRELKEIEMEINTLRRQARADVHEELQLKIETQTQLLSVFSQHNDSLQMQVKQLQKQVLSLGGQLDKEAPVSPPPMPVMSTVAFPNGEEMRQRTWSDLGRENLLLKQRIGTLEGELRKVHSLSSSVRRRSFTLHALSSVPVGTIHEELQIK